MNSRRSHQASFRLGLYWAACAAARGEDVCRWFLSKPMQFWALENYGLWEEKKDGTFDWVPF